MSIQTKNKEKLSHYMYINYKIKTAACEKTLKHIIKKWKEHIFYDL